MGKLKRIYAHRQLEEKCLFGEDEVNQRDDKELMNKTTFWYDEDTQLVYYKNTGSDKTVLFKSLNGEKHRFVDNEIILSD